MTCHTLQAQDSALDNLVYYYFFLFDFGFQVCYTLHTIHYTCVYVNDENSAFQPYLNFSHRAGKSKSNVLNSILDRGEVEVEMILLIYRATFTCASKECVCIMYNV